MIELIQQRLDSYKASNPVEEEQELHWKRARHYWVMLIEILRLITLLQSYRS